MRYIGLVLLLLMTFTACNKPEPRVVDTAAPCLPDLDLDPSYAREDLNNNYTIAFPAGYTYGGHIIYSGDYFIKKNINGKDTVSFIASYGPDNGYKSTYGEPLINTAALQVDVEYRGRIYTLKNKRRLCRDGTMGYFYFTLERGEAATRNQGLGVVYLRENNDYRQNLIIDFPSYADDEIKTIVASIAEKQ